MRKALAVCLEQAERSRGVTDAPLRLRVVQQVEKASESLANAGPRPFSWIHDRAA